jgi:hypothetical protein
VSVGRRSIHRGSQQIGGGCVELAHDGQRLVLDLGLPLTRQPPRRLPLPAGLADQAPDLLGVLVSRGHPDHYGLATRREPAVPLYCDERTAAILREAAFFSPLGPDLQPAGFLEIKLRSASGHSASRGTSPITAPSTPTHCCSRPAVAGSSIRATYADTAARASSTGSSPIRPTTSTSRSWRAPRSPDTMTAGRDRAGRQTWASRLGDETTEIPALAKEICTPARIDEQSPGPVHGDKNRRQKFARAPRHNKSHCYAGLS